MQGPAPANLHSKLSALLQQSPFVATLGLSIADLQPEQGRLVMLMPLAPSLERVQGTGYTHGGAIAALIDTAACFALAMGSAQPPPTVDLRIDFLRAARQSALRAVATVRRGGRSIGVADVEVLDESGAVVALGRGTFVMTSATVTA